MKKINSYLWAGIIILILILLVGIYLINKKDESTSVKDQQKKVKIGVITPLTGGASFWGESTVVGMELAKKDLVKQGYSVDFIFEDGKIEASAALSAAQKLTNVDNVDAIFSEYAPAATAVSSFLANKDLIHVYNAAVRTPLDESQNIYKSYISYVKGCELAAENLKNKNVSKVGILEMNLEFGALCEEGIKNQYPDVVVEKYNPGETDFRSMLAKMKNNNVEAIYNPAFPGEFQSSLKQIKEAGLDVYVVTNSDALSEEYKKSNPELINKIVTFGFPDVSQEFIDRLNNESKNKIGAPVAAGVAYTHGMQLGESLSECNDDMDCVRQGLNNSKPNEVVGFNSFKNRMADFNIPIKELD